MTRIPRKKKSPLADLPDFFKPTPEQIIAKEQRAKEIARIKAVAAKRKEFFATDVDAEAKDRSQWHNPFYSN